MCGEVHPDRPGVICESPDGVGHYGEHYAYCDGEWVNWPNLNEPKPVKSFRRNQSDASAMAAVQQAVRATDPVSSAAAAGRAAIQAGTHRSMVVSILEGSACPMSARQIGDVALERKLVPSVSSCESVRRRAAELLGEGVLVVVGECDTGQLLALS